jgi:crotonobetainyl-CoA:carnitine CoA-transferase CaiB-like acyl-CoA transferase
MPNRPLEGIRVVDFGHQIAGPLTALLLADQGADVVSVVRPGREPIDHPVAGILGRGKRRIELDLHDERSRGRARALAADAHVVVENLRPGTMDGWGLGYDDVRAVDDGVVYVSLPGYAPTDPRADLPAWEGALLAESGLLTDLSPWGAAFALPPVFTALPLPSVYAALHGAIGAVSALVGRARDGHGAHVTASLLDGAMSAAAGPLLRTVGQPERYDPPTLPTRFLAGRDLRRAPVGPAAALSRMLDHQMPPFLRAYRCADGRELFVVVIDNQGHIDDLLGVMGLDAFAAEAGLRRGDVLDAPAVEGNLYAYRSSTPALRRLRRRLAAEFATRPAAEWEELLGEAGVPCALVRTTAGWRGLDATRDSGLAVTHRAADGSEFGAPGLLADIAGEGVATAPVDVEAAQTPFDGWRDAAEPSFPDPVADAEVPAPLEGLTVLDLANVIAGPTVSRTLAELGAEVIRVDPVQPRMGPRMLLWMGQEVNQGKRSAAVDLRSPAGRTVLRELLRKSDVVVHNRLRAQAEDLGVAPDQVHAVDPAVVVSEVTAWGGSGGPGWEHRPAYDPVVQAATGVMTRFGGAGSPTMHGMAACIDYATGFAGAFGTLVALWSRTQGATRLTARTSLARTSGYMQIPFMTGRAVVEPTGLASGGRSATDRLMRTRDGWVHLAIPDERWPVHRSALASALDLPLPLYARAARPRIERALRALPSVRAVELLRAAGISVGEVKDVARLRADARHVATDDLAIHEERSGDTLLVDQGDARGGVHVPNPTWLRWDVRPRRRLRASRLPGADTDQVLRELGLEGSADGWCASGAVSRGWDLPTGPLPA